MEFLRADDDVEEGERENEQEENEVKRVKREEKERKEDEREERTMSGAQTADTKRVPSSDQDDIERPAKRRA